MTRQTINGIDGVPAPAAHAPEDLSILIETFERHLKAENKAERTRQIYTQAAQRLRTYLADNGMPLVVSNIRREHVEAFLASLADSDLSDSFRNQIYRSLQAFWKYLVTEEEVRDSPLRNLKPPRITDNLPPVISTEEMTRLLRKCDGKTFDDRRDNAILRLFYDAGLRRAELTGLRLDDLDQDSRSAHVTGKGKNERDARYGHQTARSIDRYLRARAKHPASASPALWLGQRGPLTFHGIEQIVQRRAAQAGLDHIHPHLFRHSFAHAYLSSGGQEGDLMKLAGWRSRMMVDRYARSTAADRARRNFDPHSPGDKLR